ncbi:MAG: flagellar protein FlgN [Novosphingobium meiothermophilum]|uniref:flagellar protein FlgN n=1 Tax=Novosphingobium TaxID=165696 RepID=UPI001F43A9C4|nr:MULTISPECIES: flagellar protein FlgN [Novosphingobium]
MTVTCEKPASDVRATLRQMLAVLQQERHALAGLDLDMIMGCATSKADLCGTLADVDAAAIDEECRGLLDAARRLNEANRKVRNLIAANVSARLDALTGNAQLYRPNAQVHHLRTA